MLVFLFIKESPPPPKKKYYAANTILYIDNKHFKIHKNRKQVSFNCENILFNYYCIFYQVIKTWT